MTQDDLATDDVMILDTWEQVKGAEAFNLCGCILIQSRCNTVEKKNKSA